MRTTGCLRRTNRSRAILTASAAFVLIVLCVPGAQATGKAVDLNGPEKRRVGWKLMYEETFSQPVRDRGAGWVRDDFSSQINHLDDNGEVWHINGGPAFAEALASFDMYRKRVVFGQDDWLTVELETRDVDKDGKLGDLSRAGQVPALTSKPLPGVGRVGHISVPSHHDGLLLRSTKPLPPRYRVEYKLKTINFGGERNGSLNYDGLVNGYSTYPDCKSSHPWDVRFWQQPDTPYCEWRDTREGIDAANGFYFLAISDHEDPKPTNNLVRHIWRKVTMEGFNHTRDGIGDVCNPATGEFFRYEDSTRNGVNVIFQVDVSDNGRGTERLLAASECSGERPNDNGGIGTVEMLPELMPRQDYRFAVERTETGFTLEVSGNFRFVGQQTYRYHKPFIDENGEGIWHYNQTAEEYDGRFNKSITYKGPYGTYEWTDTWPAGSAYPEHFYIGDPHTNFYEGSASIDDVRLYVPAD
jgi:hypothetical protein